MPNNHKRPFKGKPASPQTSSQGGFGRNPGSGTSSHFKQHRFGVSKGGRPYNRTSGGYKGGGGFGGNRGGGKPKFKQAVFNDISRFVNRAVVTTEEAPVFVPEHQFVDFQIDQRLKNNIITKGYVTPTPI